MRLIVQRVRKAKVKVEGKIVGEIGKGLFVLIGVSEDDKESDVLFLAEKLSKLRVMSDEEDKMNLSAKDVNAKILAVSQFTLYADTKKGNRPSFIKAAQPKLAKRFYNLFVESLKDRGVKVETGEFGSYMSIDTLLDGPVTIVMESSS